jgi:8-oxo-dGTP pyrophosphatase MutT (NUDIX family)
MIVVYTGEDAPDVISKSLFLAGPSLRPGQEDDMVSWRKEALEYLEKKDFDGVIFCPETRSGKFDKDFSYDNQIEWEHKHLNMADCILFWIPRDISVDSKGKLKLPAFTTNVEWGTWADSGRVVFGCPPDLEKRKNKYLKYYADFYKVPGGETLEETLDAALEMLGEGAEREGGERCVPLFIWKTPSFQSWYLSQKRAGNTLNNAELLYTFRPGYKKFVFLWVLKVNVHIGSEDRDKDNEFVLARTDISSVCLWHNNGGSIFEDTKIIIVKEFRSPANTEDGFIRELAGGSSFKPEEDPEEVAAEEVYEETGLRLDTEKLVSLGGRQLCGTLSSHKSYLYSYELNDEELAWLKAQDGIVHGNIEDSERTFIEIYSVKDLIDSPLTDWTTLGQILCVLSNY